MGLILQNNEMQFHQLHDLYDSYELPKALIPNEMPFHHINGK